MNTNSDTKNLPLRKLTAFRKKLSAILSASRKLTANSFPPATTAVWYVGRSKLKALLSAFRNLKPKTYNLKPSRGFTLVELLVTLSLFVVLTIVVIFSQSKFNGSILLTNLAYDVALTIRQAQSYGVNVRENTLDSSSDTSFKHAYGVHFDTNKTTEFVLFSDSFNGNGKYDDSGTDDFLVNTYKIKRGSYIKSVCVDSGSGCNSVITLDITFLRPNPDAIIKSDSADYEEAKITISSADDKTRVVTVNATGQISTGR